jgi:hypothetical protein
MRVSAVNFLEGEGDYPGRRTAGHAPAMMVFKGMRRPIPTRLAALAQALAWSLLPALGLGVSAARADLPAIVSADDEAEKANPGRSERRDQQHPQPRHGHNIHATMDRVFGEGAWRLTSGYRTAAQENSLRRAGAGTVRAGRVSRHSVGAPGQPGAIDAVVQGMSPQAAAQRLRRDGEGVDRVLAEGRHGREGAHLHIELTSAPVEDPPP